MLYASTRATLTRELGDYRFSDSIYGTDKVSCCFRVNAMQHVDMLFSALGRVHMGWIQEASCSQEC